VGVSLTQETENDAKALAKRLGLSFSAFVEMAIRAELQRRQKYIEATFEQMQPELSAAISKAFHLPYHGTVAAGLPAGSSELADETYPVADRDHYDPAIHFVVRVHGESMEPTYPDGSHIVCRKLRDGEYATKGQDVVCADANGVYFKRLVYQKDGPKDDAPRKARPRLVSINPDYPEVVPVTDCPIVAVVVGMA